ncbi:glycoside hydrolase family 140 protein [Paenibacillus sp. OV219]|uniref:glycoside hydrolase family 140 protein n=1 Tax=Paenibacillus sp. OV219 TaxID=1884377 RepID=UPI0008D0B082|nr:glycoside hydrolase family 140 protein [Paenibacillus sp. OV219]SEO83158.1 Putative collagen-binding domain of a collagenase [Paenibacillus sp. OV219]
MSTLQRLKVSSNKRFLIHEDGTPFFWLGDTAWELFHKLNREEAELYLRNRAQLKFNVVQAVALAEFDGVATSSAYGRQPLKRNAAGDYDPTMPDTDGDDHYWAHVDYIIDLAASLGLYVALLPTWGDKYHQDAFGKGPEIFNGENAKVYGRWLGERYRNRSNIIWVLGGDRSLMTRNHFEVNNGLAAGLREAVQDSQLITFHPSGNTSSSRHMHDEPWLDFNMIQSGHHEQVRENYKHMKGDYDRLPVKPVVDAEPAYEDHPVNFNASRGYFDQADVRTGAYYGVFAGGFGTTYGHHSIWSMTTEPGPYFIMTWQDALNRPGATQMQHLRALMESRSYLDRVPDQSLIADNFEGANGMVATRGENYGLIYSPNGIPFRASLRSWAGSHVSASWFDPRTGEYSAIGEFLSREEEKVKLTPPTSGRGNDWVLVLTAS